MHSNLENLAQDSDSNFENRKKETFKDKIDVKFKPIHQQIQEENEKKQQISQGSKKSLFPNLEIDEKLLNLLSKEFITSNGIINSSAK